MSLADELKTSFDEHVVSARELQEKEAEKVWKAKIVPDLLDASLHGRRRVYFRWEGFGPKPHFYEYEGRLSAFEHHIFSLAKENGLVISVIQAPFGGRFLSIGF